MADCALPQKDSPDLRLVVATPEEVQLQQHANFEEWGGALALEQYLRREKLLFSQEITKDGGLTPWVLVHQPNGSETRRMLCGCETINKKALVARGGGRVDDVVAHSVCSVFCPPKYRGRGYAGRMMSEVGKALRQWQMEAGANALFSVLYSDIGKDFYAARGWHPFPSTHVSLPTVPHVNGVLPAVRMLERDDLAELCAVDERLIRGRLANWTEPKTAVALVPDHSTLVWHHRREDFIAEELFGRYPAIKGAIVGERPGHRAWALFTRVWTNPTEEAPNTLHILRLVIEDEAFSDFAPASPDGIAAAEGSPTAHAVAALFAAAQAEAAKWDMKEVQIWNPTSTTVAAARHLDPAAAVVQREEESITSLQWYGEGQWEQVDWLCNEKYGWC